MMFLQGDPVQSYLLLREALNERNYFLQAAPYLNRELKLVIPTDSFFEGALWLFPGTMLYHMMYLKSLFSSEYKVSLSGPSFMLRSKVQEEFPNAKYIHGKYGVKMHEA
jgi:glycerol-3-phosphate dehydrogenase